MKAGSIGCIALCIAASTTMAFAANPEDSKNQPQMSSSGPYMTIPLQGWAVNSKPLIEQLKQTRSSVTTKAATDRATVYRPITPCRLIDTRGFSAAIAVAGPLAPNSTTNINSAGFCGIPNNFLVAGISLSFHVFNNTVNNGGYIAFQQQGAAVTGVNAVFNPGAQWTAATANVSIPNDSGNFSIFIANSQVQVIIDVNGYYQDLDFLDIGTQEFDISGNTSGDLFQLSNTGAGSALSVQSSTGAAITVFGGTVRAAGAGVNTTNFVFRHQVNSGAAFGSGGTICGGFPQYTVIDHPMLNGDPNALVLITPRGGAGQIPPAGGYEAFYFTGGCTPTVNGFWGIKNLADVALPNTLQFTVMVIKP